MPFSWNIRYFLVAFVLGAGLLLTRPLFAGDATITTDPLAAALMPPPHMGSSTFFPAFIRPPGRIASFELPLEMQTPDRYPTPGLMPVTPQSPVNVSITVPPSNAIFPPNSIVTFGWLPAEQEIGEGDAPNKVQYPIRYEIFISRHDRWSDRLILKAHPAARQYTHLYKPPGPGRYHWHIRAIYNRAMHGINSETRSFMVLP